jgi:hypothetical protein
MSSFRSPLLRPRLSLTPFFCISLPFAAGNVMRLSLLRSSTAPDSNQDQGAHEFKFAILPHSGHFLESNVPQAAMGKFRRAQRSSLALVDC